MKAHVKHPFVAATKSKRKTKGKRHHVHAESLDNIAHDLHRASTDKALKHFNPAQLLTVIGNIINNEAQRVQKIVR